MLRPFLTAAVLVLGVVAIPAAAGAQQPDCRVTAAVGIPGDTVDGLANAGAVEVRTSCHPDPVLLTLATPRAGDRFGAGVTVLDLDRGTGDSDGSDLLVGAPGYDVGGLGDAGAVAVFRGSSTGLSADSLLVQGSDGVPGAAQAGARFGAAVSAYRSFTDSSVSVYVGEPGKDVGGATDAGGFDTLVLVSGAVSAASSETTLNSPNVPGTAARGDLLGSSVDASADVVGAPGRTVDGQPGAGAVLAGHALLTQNSPCLAGAAEAGDHFGAVVSGIWVGVPDEDLGSIRDAGMVEMWLADGPDGTCLAFHQDVAGVSGSAEAGDRFGAAMSGIVPSDAQPDDLRSGFLVGVPGEDTGTHPDSGFVNVFSATYDDATMTYSYVPAGSSAGPNATRAAYGSAFGDYAADGTRADIAGPGGSGIVYRVGYTPGRPLQHVATYRPASAVPANTYGVTIAGTDQ